MTKKVFYLPTCKTCQRIMKEVGVDDSFEQRDIKSNGITQKELAAMHQLAGSYEALFSRRSMKYRPLGLHEMDMKEADYKNYLLMEYSFLKRPVFIIDDEIFIGNAKKTVEGLKNKLS